MSAGVESPSSTFVVVSAVSVVVLTLAAMNFTVHMCSGAPSRPVEQASTVLSLPGTAELVAERRVGRGRVVVDGESHTFVPGTTAFLGHNVRHEIINESDTDLVMQWLISPPGLDEFFATIGRERHPGEPAPEPFARPDDVVAVESNMGFRDVD